MRHANASPSYNARASRMRMRGLSKSANRTSRLIYGFCKPCTVIGLSRGWSEARRRTKCEIIQERQIEFRRAYISGRLDLKISFVVIIILTRRHGGYNASFLQLFQRYFLVIMRNISARYKDRHIRYIPSNNSFAQRRIVANWPHKVTVLFFNIIIFRYCDIGVV